jgi:membrane protease subunit (stomatin/prohibitin family)
LPILTNLKNWDKAFASPFKSDVYFISSKLQLDQRWGTSTPITFRDKEFGAIRIRSYGTFAYRVVAPKTFIPKIAGTKSEFRTADLDGQLLSLILTRLTSHFANNQVSFLDMAANQDEFSKTLKDILAPAFVDFGLELTSFFVQNISLPEELQKVLDKHTSMKMLGDLHKYTQFQTAESIPLAAQNEGGGAGMGVGLGAGIAMGQKHDARFVTSFKHTTSKHQ